MKPHRLLILFVALLVSLQPVAASVGLFVRSDTASVPSPEAGKTFCLKTTDGKLYRYDGSSWIPQTLGKINATASTAPSVSNDNTQGYGIGSIWLDTTNKKAYVCVDAATGAASWHEISNRIQASDIVAKFNTSDAMSDFVVSGLIGSDPGASLAMTTPSGVAYVGGSRLVSAGFSRTYTPEKDTYDYLQSNGTVNHVEVPNDDPAPSGQPGLLLQKVVTDDTEITAVTGLASSYPTMNVASATAGQHAVSKSQADSLYSPIGIYASGPANRVVATPDGGAGVASQRALVNNDLPVVSIAKGGTNNGSLGVTNLGIYHGNGTQIVQSPIPSGTLKKFRLNSAGDGFEWADDTNGTVTTISMTAPGVLFQSPVSISNPTSTPAIGLALRTDVAANRFIGDNGSGSWAERAIAAGDLPTIPLNKGGTNNASYAATENRLAMGDGSKLVDAPALGAGQSIRMNGAGTALEAFTPSGDALLPNDICNVRVSATTGVPITTSDVTGATSIYLMSYRGNRVGLYDGSQWQIATLPSEITISLSGLTANTVHDVFLYDSDANGTADAVDVVAWTNDTTRATAIAYQDGVPCKTGALGRRLVASFRTTGTIGECEDSVKFRGICNVANPVEREVVAADTTDSWSYNSTTFRSFNNSTTLGVGAVRVLSALNTHPVKITAMINADYSASGVNAKIGIGVDSTTTNSAQIRIGTKGYSSGANTSNIATLYKQIGVGAHLIYPLEAIQSGTTAKTFYGDAAGAQQSGLIGVVMQ